MLNVRKLPVRGGVGQPVGKSFSRFHRTLFTIVVTSMVSGCAYTGSFRDYVHNGLKVGPEYFKPASPIADSWIDEYDERVKTELPNYADWWTVFNDPTLDQLMEDLYAQNLTLRVAGLRVLEARYLRAIAVGSFFPQGQEAFGSYTHIKESLNTVPNKQFVEAGLPITRSFDLQSVGFGAIWELDVWGKFRRNIEAADASLNASVEDYDAILVSLLGETAATYAELRSLQQRLKYAQQNVEIQQGSLGIAEVKFGNGAVTELDVTQARNNLADTSQLIPLLENQARLANNRLCVLLGIPPRDLTEELGPGPIPTAAPQVAVGIPANLLRRRPDVRAAERLVAAQSARIGVAAADLLPHFSVRGAIQLDSENLSDLFKSGSTAGAFTGGFDWDILNYGRLLNNVLVQDARFQQLAVDYQQTVLQANAEVEDAINSFLKSQERLLRVAEAVESSRRSVDIAVTQYRANAIDFNRVFNLQTRLVEDQDTLAIVQGDIALSLIATYRALGGGWEIRYGIRRGAGPAVAEAGSSQPTLVAPEAEVLPPVPADER